MTNTNDIESRLVRIETKMDHVLTILRSDAEIGFPRCADHHARIEDLEEAVDRNRKRMTQWSLFVGSTVIGAIILNIMENFK